MRRRPFRIAFIPTQSSGVTYYRMALWAWEMRKRKNVQVAVYGFNYEIEAAHPWLFDVCPEVEARLDAIVRDFDITVWGPVYTPRAFELFGRLKLKYQKPMLYETDDDITDVPTWNEGQGSCKPSSGYRANAIAQMRLSDGAICTTPYLKERLEQFCDNVHIVPNSLDFRLWRQQRIKAHDDIRIGWAGGRNHSIDLMQVIRPIQDVLERFPQAKLCLINSGLKNYAKAHNDPWYFEGYNHFYADRYVQINRYPYFLASFRFDIGIAPLEICNFNKAKSNLRWLEYAGLKVPTVATKVGHFEATLTHGQDALLVDNNDPAKWEEYLSLLVENEAERRRIGETAWNKAKADFNIYRNSAKYLDLLKEIAGAEAESEDELCNDLNLTPTLAA